LGTCKNLKSTRSRLAADNSSDSLDANVFVIFSYYIISNPDRKNSGPKRSRAPGIPIGFQNKNLIDRVKVLARSGRPSPARSSYYPNLKSGFNYARKRQPELAIDV
jgi:hypothetical protein